MFGYQIKNALRSLRRNPVLSGLLVLAIALGVAVSTAALAVYYIYSGNPIPQKSDQLFYVELDNWIHPLDTKSDEPEDPPILIAYRDMIGLSQSDIPTYQSGMFRTHPTVFPNRPDQPPFGAKARMCHGDFFSMFDAPFAYGNRWDKSADTKPEPVVVLNAETNQKLYGGVNSVGKKLQIEDRLFTIVGVLAPWRPNPKFYDPDYGNSSTDIAEIFLPLAYYKLIEPTRTGTTICQGPMGPTLEDLLQSECVWIQMWVQLDSPQQKEEYLAYLDAYVTEQKKLGRYPRPLNNRLLSVMELLRDRKVVPEEAKGLAIISLLFLVVCSVNLIGILLGKFLSLAPQMGLRRAMGASKLSIFIQHIIECEVVGVLGGVVGLGLSVLVLAVVNRALGEAGAFGLDLNMLGAGLVLSLVAGLVAGIYPAWRICRVPPAVHLKLQ